MIELTKAWMAQLDFNSLVIGLLAGLVVAVIIAVLTSRSARRRGAADEQARLQPLNEELDVQVKRLEQELADSRRNLAVTETRLEEQQLHYREEKASLE